jgi:hypothetical protein
MADQGSQYRVQVLLAIFLSKGIRYQKNGLKPTCPKFLCERARD